MYWRIRPLLLGALMLAPAATLADSESVKLSTALNHASVAKTGSFEAYAASLAQRRRRAAATMNPLSLRIGAALGDNSGLLIGFDIGVPSISIGAGWTGRVDLDIWGFGDDDTNVALILNQITSSDGKTYFGFGLGIVTGDEGGLGVKLLIGTTISDRADLEFNLILADDVVPAVVARIHL